MVAIIDRAQLPPFPACQSELGLLLHQLQEQIVDNDSAWHRRYTPPRQAEALIHLVRCECGSVARGALSDDGRCTNAIGRDEQEHGHTLCSRCRPPDFLFRFRARRIARNLDRMILESGNQFEPPLNFEISVRRHYELFVRTVQPMCHCPCGDCGPRHIPHQPEDLILPNVRADPQLTRDDLVTASHDFRAMLISHLLQYRIWDLPVWVPSGRLNDWLTRQREAWDAMEAPLDPNRDYH